MDKKYNSIDLPVNFKVKLMLYNDEPTFSVGVISLLELIEKYGSLNKACKEMSMAYSKGLRILRRAENDLGFKLVEGTVGGVNGGGSKLTDEGKLFYDFYIELDNKLKEFTNQFLKHKA